MRITKKNREFEVSGFIINKKYSYKEYSRNDEESGRTYNVDEFKIPSVTTILNKTQSEEKKIFRCMEGTSRLSRSCTDHEPSCQKRHRNALCFRTIFTRDWLFKFI